MAQFGGAAKFGATRHQSLFLVARYVPMYNGRKQSKQSKQGACMSSRALIALLSVIATVSSWAGLDDPTYAAGGAEPLGTTTSKTPPTSGAPAISPAMLPGAIQFDMKSKITGRTYRIYVAVPSGPPPHAGYPAVYVLDASKSFATVASQAEVGRSEGRPAVLIVGIGYPDSSAAQLLRSRDLTPSEPKGASREVLERLYGPIKPGDYGGAEAFHQFMMQELRPLIMRLYAVDPHKQSLMGYSFGGLFVLHVLFEQPDAYNSYVVGSPSIWWNDREVLKGEAGFASAVRAGKAAPRILVTSNEWEQFEGASGLPPEQVKILKLVRMVDNARELESRLQAIQGSTGYDVQYFLFLHETHGSGIPAAASRGIAFISRP
jgi:predicted alpha/beta superfamily hydrolase